MAIKEFRRAIDIDPKLPEAHLKLGLAHSSIAVSVNDRGESLKASLKAFQEAVRLKPDWPEALNHLGDRYRTFQEYDKSITSLKEAIRLRPEFPDAQENLAMTYLYAGHHTEALVWLRKVTSAGPPRPLSHKLLGLTYLILDDKEKALEQYTILQSLDPEMAKYLQQWIQSSRKPFFGVLNGRMLSVRAPEYPEMVRRRRIQGTVTVELVIDETGKVVKARAIDGPVELRAPSEAAARTARFKPTELSGKAVSVNGVIQFRFVY
jgi:TonB family protein